MTRLIFAMLISILATYPVSTVPAQECLALGDQTDCKPCRRPGSEPGKEVYNKPADVTAVELDWSEIRIPSNVEKNFEDRKNFIVEVSTTAVDPEGDVVTYNYTVSGGRIIGTGARVIWDLKGVMPGTYTITAGIDDGCGICGQTKTKTIKVVQD